MCLGVGLRLSRCVSCSRARTRTICLVLGLRLELGLSRPVSCARAKVRTTAIKTKSGNVHHSNNKY